MMRGPGIKGSLLVSVVVLALAAASGIIPFRHVLAQEKSVDLAVRQRDALIAENQRLEAQIAALETPAEVERLAREHFGLVMPGEIAYVANSTEEWEKEVAPVVEAPASRPWWESFWDFLTGGDLVDDG